MRSANITSYSISFIVEFPIEICVFKVLFVCYGWQLYIYIYIYEIKRLMELVVNTSLFQQMVYGYNTPTTEIPDQAL